MSGKDMRGIISGRKLVPIGPFSRPKKTIQALKTPISGKQIQNNRNLAVARPHAACRKGGTDGLIRPGSLVFHVQALEGRWISS